MCTWRAEPLRQGFIMFCELVGNLVACRIFSTVGKDQRFVDGGCRAEFAYVVPQLASDSSSLGLLQEEERFEKIKSCGTQYIIDAIDDIPPDNTLVHLLELFRNHEKSIALV